MGFGQSLAHVQEFLGALQSAAPVFDIIDRVPTIDSLSLEGVLCGLECFQLLFVILEK